MTTPAPLAPPAAANARTAPAARDPESSGFILVGVVMFMLALTILGLSLFSLSSYEGQFFYASVSREQSLHSSESGMEVVKALLAAPGSRLESAQLAVGQFGITRALAYQRLSSNAGDTTSRGPINWDSTLVIVVSARAGNEQRTVESRFVPQATKSPYKQLVTCGLGFEYNSANGGTRTVEMAGKVWQHVQWPSDTAWTSAVNWTTGRPLDGTTPPVPLGDAFVDARLPGAYDLTNDVGKTGSGSSSEHYTLSLVNTGTTPRYFTLTSPTALMHEVHDPELGWYGCFFDLRTTLTVRGTCVLVVPDGACFLREVTIVPDGSGATGNLILVAKGNGRDPGHENRGIWFEGGLIHSSASVRVFLVSQGDISITHDHNASPSTSHESRALSVVCGGDFEVMGPNPGYVFKLAYASAMDAVADDLLSRGALPTVAGGSGTSFAYARSSWLETRLP